MLDLTSFDWTLSDLLTENATLRIQVEVLAERVRQLWPRAKALDEVVRRIRDDRASLIEIVKLIEARVGFFMEAI